jgi:hypothetical protein
MRRLLVISGLLFLAGCAAKPQVIQSAPPPPQAAPPPSTHTRSEIMGLTTDELVRRLGTPALQIREGESLKLQFRGTQCVLDAYLYPASPGREPYRVIYVDARTRSLNRIDQTACIASLERY